MKRLLLPALLVLSLFSAGAADRPAPLKILLLAGGCCHDYSKQKDILKAGLEKRANCKVDVIYSPDSNTKPQFPIYGHDDYAKGYDLIIHDECAADINDPAIVEGVLKPHRDGIPGVNLHCAMHCYRVAQKEYGKPQAAGTPGAMWFEYLGLQSTGHGAQLPIAITVADAECPINKGSSDWTTVKEELYNNVQIFPGAKAVWRGMQGAPKNDQDKGNVVAWTNTYMDKTRVFSTTIGHNNDTVSDDRYLDFVTRGCLWAVDKLKDDGTPKEGYEAAK